MRRRVWGLCQGVSTAVLYGSLALFISILHNVFLLYYVETFVSVYKIDKMSFWLGETVFLIWNSLNDPLFGWLSDRSFLSSPQSGSQITSPEVVLKRLQALSRSGPLFALSFLAFWVAWTWPGLQFLICLCLYDGFLTVVDLNHNALLADLAVSAHDRTRLNFHSSLFSAMGSLSVFLSYSFWNKENFYSFRLFCVTLATLSMLGFFVVSRLLRHRFQNKVQPCKNESQALTDKITGFVKIANNLGLENLSSALSFVCFYYCIALFDSLHSNRVFTEGTCKLLNLVITDLVDEDFVLNRRQQAASALLFGMVALVTKPGQTFAPLIGTWLLCLYTGYDIFERNSMAEAPIAAPAVPVPLRQGCFYLLVFVPISCALLQLLTWSRFTLHGRRLQNIKTLRQGAQHSHLIDVKAI
uniref:Major facilitator superfamily domain containing 13A n=1 Tax=Sinocyclocheilus rhinocerous TaxID=307959 RepID=A0A673I5G1_9TELE